MCETSQGIIHCSAVSDPKVSRLPDWGIETIHYIHKRPPRNFEKFKMSAVKERKKNVFQLYWSREQERSCQNESIKF